MDLAEKEKTRNCVSFLFLEATPRFELGNQSFADSCLTTWLCRLIEKHLIKLSAQNGADDGARTRYLHLGKVALYQMSYIRILFGASGRNRTIDTGIFSPLLYRLSYRGISEGKDCLLS